MNCVDKITWCGKPISLRRWSENLIGQATVARDATNLEEVTFTNFPERDDVQWMKAHASAIPSERTPDQPSTNWQFWTETVPRRRSPHRAVTASDLHLRVVTPLVLGSS